MSKIQFHFRMGYERESLRMTRNAQNLMASRNLTPSPLHPNPDIPVL